MLFLYCVLHVIIIIIIKEIYRAQDRPKATSVLCCMVVWSWTTIFIFLCCDTVGWVINTKILAVKTVREMTYSVSRGTLNSYYALTFGLSA